MHLTTGAAVARRGVRVFEPAPGLALRVLLTMLVPVAVFTAIVERGTAAGVELAELVVVVAVLAAVARRPGVALVVLVVFVPLQQVLLAALLRIGLPVDAVRGLGGVKEAVVVGVAIAALSAFQRDGRRVDLLDGLVLTYLVLLLVYLLAPYVFRHELAAVGFHVRLLAVRDDGLFALAFLGARHADLTARARRALVVAVLAVAAAVAATTVFEYLSPSTWNRFLVDTVELPTYQAVVLHVAVNSRDLIAHGSIGTTSIIRPSGLLLSALTVGFALLLPLALALQRFTERRVRLVFGVLAAITSTAVIVTLTRSAILAFLVTTLVCVRTGFRRLTPGRLRLLLLVLLAVVTLAPLAGSSQPVQRVAATFSGSDTSTSDHESSLRAGLDTIRSAPLGLGLGTAPAIGDRFEVAGRVTSENAYLQVGNELGVETMAVFVGALVLLLVRLRRASTGSGPDAETAAAAFAAGVGLAVGGFFLHIWADFPTAVVFWAVAGAVLDADRGPGHAHAARPGTVRTILTTRG